MTSARNEMGATRVWVLDGGPGFAKPDLHLARVGMEAPQEFFRMRPEETSCFPLSEEAIGPRPNPWESTGFKFEALTAAGAMQPQNAIVARDGRAGLDVVHTVRIHPQYDCPVLHLDVFPTSGLVRFEAVGALGAVVSRAELAGAGTGTQRVTLRSFRDRFHYVRVISPNAQCLIESLCWERTPRQPNPPMQSTRVNFENTEPATSNNPLQSPVGHISTSQEPLIIEAVPGQGVNGLKLAGTTMVNFIALPPGTSDRVTVRVFDPLGGTSIVAWDPSMTFMKDTATTTGYSAPQTFTLNGPAIAIYRSSPRRIKPASWKSAENAPPACNSGGTPSTIADDSISLV